MLLRMFIERRKELRAGRDALRHHLIIWMKGAEIFSLDRIAAALERLLERGPFASAHEFFMVAQRHPVPHCVPTRPCVKGGHWG